MPTDKPFDDKLLLLISLAFHKHCFILAKILQDFSGAAYDAREGIFRDEDH